MTLLMWKTTIFTIHLPFYREKKKTNCQVEKMERHISLVDADMMRAECLEMCSL